jgi:hypothetical protein
MPGLEVKKQMNFTKKMKLVVAAFVAVAVLALAIPYAAYAAPADDSSLAASRNLYAKGVARYMVDGDNVTVPANFTLTLEHAEGTAMRFNVVGGTVDVDGEIYTITSGNGGVLRARHLILLKADGTGPDGQPFTFKLAGRYFWIGGHLYVARIGARLLTENGNFTLLMRAAIRV